MITLQPDSATPLVRQVFEALAALIDKGSLRPGARLAEDQVDVPRRTDPAPRAADRGGRGDVGGGGLVGEGSEDAAPVAVVDGP